MRILHIYDIAGVAYVLAKWQNRTGHTSDVINQFDPFGYHDFYAGNMKVQDPEECAQVIESISPFYDILHVHSVYQILPRIAKAGKPIVMHYHGSDVMREDPFRKYCEQFAKAFLVSNEYLLKYQPGARWLPNPVDTEHFKPQNSGGGGAFTFDIEYLDRIRLLHDMSDEFTFVERGVSYRNVPAIFSRYGGYIDIKYHKEWGLLPALSKTGLEALACGLRVLNYKKEWAEGLPEQHRPENVVKTLDGLYTSLIRK